MAWTYDPSKLSTSQRDQVRFLAQDTVSTDPLVQDEEIAFVLTLYGDSRAAAASICEQIAAKFSRQADRSVQSLRVSLSEKSKMYAARAKELRSQVVASVKPFAGGMSQAEKLADQADSDRVQPSFQRGQFDEEPPVI